jgi:signal transduction histidine kinase
VLSLPDKKPIPLNIFTTGTGAHLEFRYLNQVGEYRWFRASAKRYQPEAGPEQIIGLIIDINDVKLLEAQRQAVNEELKAFMYSVAHDLRAPVRHIASFAEVIREEPDAPAEERELYLGYVEQSADKLGKMIDGLLMLSRNQRYVPQIVPVNIENLLEDLIRKTRQSELQAPELIIEHDAFPIIHTDAGQIEQVIQNLLSNAIKYSSTQERAVVRINYYLQESQHIISFSDNGIGFDPAYADKLFKLFSRLYIDDDIPGTGVGLASVHRIMRNLNGVIEADGKPGVGATFTIRLPVKVGATSAF